MVLSDSDRDTDLIDLFEADDETLYRLASPVHHNDKRDNSSSEEDYHDEGGVLPTGKDKVKPSSNVRHVRKSSKKLVGGQTSVKTKVGKLRRGAGKHGKSRTNERNISRSNPPFVPINGDSDREHWFSDQCSNRNSGRMSHESPSSSPQSGDARGNISDRSPRNDRLSRARRSEMPDEIVVTDGATKLKQPNLAPRDSQSGGRQH